MGSVSDLRRGAIIKYNGENHTILEHVHVTPGKGPAHHQVKMRNMSTGKLSEARFRPSENIDLVRVEKHEYQYLYQDGDLLFFMNTKNYEQIPVPIEMLGNKFDFLKENQTCMLSFEGEQLLDVELPLTVDLKVVHTEPGVRGDTATNVMKPATVESGASVQVPLFIEEGDTIKVNTEEESYVERVSKEQ